jgi:putative transposase
MLSQFSIRKPMRLYAYNYGQEGAYFITICTSQRQHLLGNINSTGDVSLSPIGELVKHIWEALPQYYPDWVSLDTSVFMPDHMHAIIWLGKTTEGASPSPTTNIATPYFSVGDVLAASHQPTIREGASPSPTSLSSIIARFKSMTTVAYYKGMDTKLWPYTQGKLWQRGFYDHVLRNDDSLEQCRTYIMNNPNAWLEQHNNSEVV